MRVLHVVTRFAQGGSEQDILRQITWEQSHGFDVEVAIGGSPTASSPAEGVIAHPIPSLVPEIRPRADARALRELRALIRSRRYDIVHTHQSKAGVLGRLAARNATSAIAHTVHMASFGPGYSWHASRVQATAERYCARFTDVIVCVGDELRTRYLQRHIGRPERYVVMRTPVDVEAFARARELADDDRAALRVDLGLPPGVPLVVAVGALEPRKRHELLIEQLAPLLRAHEVVLAIAGEGPARAMLSAQIAALDLQHAVFLLGHTSRVVELLSCADALALTSRVEGVPRVVIEALAAGVPVVAADVEGLREVPGAPIAIVGRDGVGLTSAVRALIAERPAPVPSDHLAEWRPAAVDAQIAAIHERLLGTPR